MKYFTSGMIGLLILSLMVVGTVQAQDINLDTTAEMQTTASSDLPEVSVTPGDPLYGMMLIWEEIVDIFVVGEAQIERNITLAQKRLAEARVTAEAQAQVSTRQALNRAEARYNQAIDIYERESDRLSNEVKTDIAARLNAAVSTHIDVLTNIMTEIDAEARAGLQTAVDNSSRIVDRLENLRANIEANLDASETEVRDRLEAIENIDVESRIRGFFNADTNTESQREGQADERSGSQIEAEADSENQGSTNDGEAEIESETEVEVNTNL